MEYGGDVAGSLPIFKQVFEMNKNWKILTPRLVPVGLLNVSDDELESILSVVK